MDEYFKILLIVLINIPVIILLGKVLFGDFDGFFYSISFLGKFDLFSFFKGEFLTDVYHEIKLVLFGYLCWKIVSLELSYFGN